MGIQRTAPKLEAYTNLLDIWYLNFYIFILN